MGERTERDRPSVFKRNPWLYLLIVLPIPAVIAYLFFVGAVVVLAAPAALVPWHPKGSLRLIVSFLAAAGVIGIAWEYWHP